MTSATSARMQAGAVERHVLVEHPRMARAEHEQHAATIRPVQTIQLL